MSNTRDAIHSMCRTIDEYYDGVTDIVRAWPAEPTPGSSAVNEITTIRNFVMMAASHASLSIEDGGDHLIGLTKLATEPVSVTTCFTCIRSMLESCAIGAWLVDPEIDVMKRQARVFAFRRKGMSEFRKFVKCVGDDTVASELSQKLARLEQDATAAGLSLTNTPDSKKGTGIIMPAATDMIRDVLALDEKYRVLSGFAHGHHWARQIIYKQTAQAQVAGAQGVLLTKTLSAESFMLICQSGFLALTRVVWNRSRFWGVDTDPLEELVDSCADQLQIKPPERFWRTAA